MDSLSQQIQKMQLKLALLKSHKSIASEELKKYQDDFKVLTDSEEIIAQLNAVAENNSILERTLSANKFEIVSLGKLDTIPGFDILFGDYDEKITEKIKNVNKVNENYKDSLLETAKTIDSVQSTIAIKIDELVKKINGYEDEIEKVEAFINKYS